jgi:DNA-directed RNA polymerase specialized sigma24 family protein
VKPIDSRDPSAKSFRDLLIWLDGGDDSRGERYLEMRRRLARYFERKRCELPDALADETLNRVARRLAEEGTIHGVPAQYCYIVAKFVLHEYWRDAARRRDVAERQLREAATIRRRPDNADASQLLLSCLDRCLATLSDSERVLIVDYYQGERRQRIEQRKQLAGRLGVSANALMIRASRIRLRLEQCVNQCCGDDRIAAHLSHPSE